MDRWIDGPMKLIAGLGNPGQKYRGTRHNVGFDVVDELAARHGLTWESAPAEAVLAKWRGRGTLLAKPLTFMNLSGRAVGDLLRFFKIDLAEMLVVVDDINLDVGRLRARSGGSAGGHNGLKSLIELLGTEEFARLRIGVGRGMRAGIWPITCSRGSTRTRIRWSRKRWVGQPTPPNCSSPRASTR
jgi:peptidyl-tRNA hydrolase, PTH1 family